jgi:hypothetical protein
MFFKKLNRFVERVKLKIGGVIDSSHILNQPYFKLCEFDTVGSGKDQQILIL